MSHEPHADKQVARRILAGDAAAFRTLFDSYFPRLYRFALARLNRDHEAANDVVQQTFCKALEHLHTFRGEAALYTWFCQVCRNCIVDYCRARQREAVAIVPLEDLPNLRSVLEALQADVRDEPDLGAWQQDMRRLVQATVDSLPDQYADILELKYVQGLPVADIATRLQLGVKAAESLLGRARTAFRAAITQLAEDPDYLQPPRASG